MGGATSCDQGGRATQLLPAREPLEPAKRAAPRSAGLPAEGSIVVLLAGLIPKDCDSKQKLNISNFFLSKKKFQI